VFDSNLLLFSEQNNDIEKVLALSEKDVVNQLEEKEEDV